MGTTFAAWVDVIDHHSPASLLRLQFPVMLDDHCGVLLISRATPGAS